MFFCYTGNSDSEKLGLPTWKTLKIKLISARLPLKIITIIHSVSANVTTYHLLGACSKQSTSTQCQLSSSSWLSLPSVKSHLSKGFVTKHGYLAVFGSALDQSPQKALCTETGPYVFSSHIFTILLQTG